MDVCYAQVHEGGDRVVELVVDDRDLRLVRGGAPARVHDHPRVGEFDHARVLLQHNLAAENLGVEGPGPSDVSYGDEERHEEALARRGQVFEVDVWSVLGHWYLLLRRISFACAVSSQWSRGERAGVQVGTLPPSIA